MWQTLATLYFQHPNIWQQIYGRSDQIDLNHKRLMMNKLIIIFVLMISSLSVQAKGGKVFLKSAVSKILATKEARKLAASLLGLRLSEGPPGPPLFERQVANNILLMPKKEIERTLRQIDKISQMQAQKKDSLKDLIDEWKPCLRLDGTPVSNCMERTVGDTYSWGAYNFKG